MKERCYSESTSNNVSSSYIPSHTHTIYWGNGHYETCKCCCGSGVQRKCNGIKIICPCCNGSGRRWVSTPCHPHPQPYPYYPVIWCNSQYSNQ